MIKPILACDNPYRANEAFKGAGWNIDFSQPIESGDPLVEFLCAETRFY